MDILTIVGIAVGLAMDAFAVSITTGFSVKDIKPRQALKMAVFFGGFQFLMPIIGWLAGLTLRNYIMAFDHWIAFILLSYIGGRMIYESFQSDKEESDSRSPFHLPNLLVLAIATSIDALAVGFSLSLLNTTIAFPAIIIGIITFVLSFAGVFIGKQFGHLFEKKIEIFGGLVLIGIGVKILIEHLR